MTAPLRKHDASPAHDLPVSQARGEASMIAEHAEYRAVDRRLRNRMLLANTVAWIAIIFLVRFIFF